MKKNKPTSKLNTEIAPSGYRYFLKRDPADPDLKWSELLIHAYIVQQARKEGYLLIGGAEQGQRSMASGARLKACGMAAGNPDLTFYLVGGKSAYVELKTLSGKLSKDQIHHHEEMKKRGHSVKVIYASCPADGWEQVVEYIRGVEWTEA